MIGSRKSFCEYPNHEHLLALTLAGVKRDIGWDVKVSHLDEMDEE